MNSTSCFEIVNLLKDEAKCLHAITLNKIAVLDSCCLFKEISEEESNYSKPMVWIGIYIAVASLLCVLAMACDLLHGFRNRKFWFPCKFFTLNATSITIITIAMKLPVDLNTPMYLNLDVYTKLGSLVFMSTMITNLMPSLASMNNKELLANATGLVILVITLVVNTLIQLKTGLYEFFEIAAVIRLCGLVCPLIIFIFTAISIPTIKQILEFKYQIASTHMHPHDDLINSNAEELKQYLRRYWIMAKTSNPHFVIATTPLCCAATVTSVSVAIVYLTEASYVVMNGDFQFDSDYEWSMLVIGITQFIGIVVGNIAPLFRCFAALGFKVSILWTISHLKVFKVESYWTHKLSSWKESHIASSSSGRCLSKNIIVHNLKNFLLWLCIGFEKIIVASCKVIGLIPIFVILVMYSLYHVKSLITKLLSVFLAKTQHNTVQDLDHNDSTDEDMIRNYYVLQLEDEKKLAERTVKHFLNSLNRLMQKAEKKQLPKNLMQLLHRSTGFEGVKGFDSDEIEPLHSVELISCWSLPVVTLTCIAIALPDVRKDIVDSLINGVREGLSYTSLVDEECLKSSHDYVNIQTLIKNLWDEADVNCKWLDKTLKRNAYKGKTSKEIVKSFNDKAKEVVARIHNINQRAVEQSRHKFIAANSMYRITQTIMVKKRDVIEQNSGDHQLFDMLSCMIADILVACLTNLTRVIVIKCRESVIEKREDSLEAAAELLGRSKEIITDIQTRELPAMDPNNMKCVEEWRNYLNAVL